MKSKLKFAISALVWALMLMAAYVVSMHAQTNTTANQPAAKKGSAAETFGINPAVTGSGAAGLLAKFVGDGSVAFPFKCHRRQVREHQRSHNGPGIEAHRAGDD